MESKGFSCGEMIKRGWLLTKEHIGFFIPYLLVFFVVWVIGNVVSVRAEGGFSILVWLLFFLIDCWLAVGFIKACLRAAAGEKPSFGDLVPLLKHAFPLIVVAILYQLLVTLGMILLIIPGVYWAIKYYFALWAVVDNGMGIKEAFSESAKITDGIKWDLGGLYFLLMIIALLGMLALGVGLLVAMPVGGIALALVYTRFKTL